MTNLFSSHFEKMAGELSPRHLHAYLEGIYKSDHHFSYHRFHETAKWVSLELSKLGVETRIIEYPADGKTRFGDWVMPMAWDAHSATLKDLSRDELIADYEKTPNNLVMWSAPTPEGGVRAKLVKLSEPEDLKESDVKGAFVLTCFNPINLKAELVAQGAVGVLFVGELLPKQMNAVRWINSWADEGDMWAFRASDTPLVGFSISPSQREELIERLDGGEEVILEAHVDTRLYEGTLPVVEAFIPGEEKEEVFLTGHLYEQGANDNASGTATMMELARMFSDKKPKRGLRFLFTSEIYGTVPYCFENSEIMNRCIAGINIDSTAEVARGSGKMDIICNPMSNASYGDVLFKEIVNSVGLGEKFAFKSFLLDDNLVCDPQIGVPCFLVGVCSENWHTSLDTMEVIDAELFEMTTQTCAAWVHYVANGGEDEAKLLLDPVNKFMKGHQEHVLKKEREDSPFRQDYFDDVKAMMFDSLNRMHPVVKSTYIDRGEVGLIRRFYGPPSYEDIPFAERVKNNFNMWSSEMYLSQHWANGRRSEERVVAYAALNFNRPYHKLQDRISRLKENAYLIESHHTETLINDFCGLGIVRGDILIVHGSLKAIGHHIEGGAGSVIRALLSRLGPEGTLLMPVFNHVHENIDLREDPSRLGALSESFRTWPGVLRSHNPSHSICALGKRAEEFISGHENSTQLGLNSPLHKAAEAGAKILHLGTTLSSCSLLHVAEVIAGMPYLHVSYPDYSFEEMKYVDSNGCERILKTKESPADSNGFTRLMDESPELEKYIYRGWVGKAESLVFEAKGLLEVAVKCLKNDPRGLLCKNPKCRVCRESERCCEELA